MHKLSDLELGGSSARRAPISRSAVFACLALLAASPIRAQVTLRVSLDSGGQQGNSFSYCPSITPDGRYVAFASNAHDLTWDDTNGYVDVFVRDRWIGTTELVSRGDSQVAGDGDSSFDLPPSISADGRYVAFVSWASNLVSGDTNQKLDIFVRDRRAWTTERVSVATGGAQGNGHCRNASISADGRYVAFDSESSNLVPQDWNGHEDVFVRDRRSGTTEIVSVTSGGWQGGEASWGPSISADGRYVAFTSDAWDLVGGDTNWALDVFVHDRRTGTTGRVSVASSGEQGNGDSELLSISPDGRYVVFWSVATNLVPGDTNGARDVFLFDRVTRTTERVSVANNGAEGNADSGSSAGFGYTATVSADGRYVVFSSFASNLLPGDTNESEDAFLRDRWTGTTKRLSVSASGAQGRGRSAYFSPPSISADGRYVAFDSEASNLVAGDTNAVRDVFVRDREATGFTTLCDPGVGGVRVCPCSNPPSGRGRGCENSSASGGASLSASGVAYLSMDALVFTTGGERPAATSILIQGNAPAASGVVYGQGVRCAGGALVRLYTKSATGGGITAPDLAAGDPTVSARSAAKGDTIQPGQSRWYFVGYRDPNVLGGCPGSSTFNATQTGRVDWSL